MTQRVPLNPVTLHFRDAALEWRYRESGLPALRRQSRLAIFVGLVLYALSTFLDGWFVPAEQLDTVAVGRWLTMGPAIGTLLYTYSHWFRRFNSIPLSLVGAYAAAGTFLVLWLGDNTIAMYYSTALILIILFTYSFVGARFIHALMANLLLVAAYNLVFGLIRPYPVQLLLTQDFFFLCANVIGAFACYLDEAHRRQLFFREQELDEERRHHLERSLHDPLTGLPNRELLHDRLEQALRRAGRSQQGGVGVFIDLDAFKPINDSFGHSAGDSVLKAVATRLRKAVRDSDTVARLGGDEFFIVANGTPTQKDIQVLADSITAALAIPVDLPGGQQITRIHASLGCCAFPYEGVTPSDIIRRADHAMYSIKRAGGSGAAHYDEPEPQLAPAI
ncbi:MAG: GGDEF domain-containing protein [Gammaproteobacteria bacterium]|nr:GGDEF domain-containing protein [Gammaproteobacteria bacterium]MBU1416291.1 GGDEF domain-containing protein [Gammaproteobacteria bacterium]